MDESAWNESGTRNYGWYVRGCRKLNWPLQLSPTEFSAQYGRYWRCDRTIQRYEDRRMRHIRRRRGSTYNEDAFLERLMKSIRQERELLHYLSTAVFAGQGREDEEGGAGMPAYRRPDQPVLVGAGAKLPPHLDPEPDVRDP